METISLYWATAERSYEEIENQFSRYTSEQLKNLLINTHYNKFLRKFADYDEGGEDLHNCGKRLPYIGWYWRDVDFAEKTIPIGICREEFTGIIVNNKWDYDERLLTEQEADHLIFLIDEAFKLSCEGGCCREIRENTELAIDKIWTWMQTLEIKKGSTK